MSFEAYLLAREGSILDKDVPGNITWSIGPMFREALGFPFSELNGRSAAFFTVAIERAVTRMRRNPAKYRALEPPNGIPAYEAALNYLVQLRDAVRRNPRATIVVN